MSAQAGIFAIKLVEANRRRLLDGFWLPDVSDEHGSVPMLVVAWQNFESRKISPVGLLEHDRNGYRFRYIRNARNVTGLLPFLGSAT